MRVNNVERLIRQLAGPGWIVERGRKHYRARLPGRCDFVTVITDQGGWRTLYNLRASLKRYQRRSSW
jgi:hypothetical protein